MEKTAIGIDIGGTNTVIGIVDKLGNVLGKEAMLTPTHGDIHLYISDITKVIQRLMQSAKAIDRHIEFLGIGIGAPNGNYYNGSIEQATNLKFKGVVPFVGLLKESFPDIKTMALTNDANAAAIGEMVYGGAKGMKNFMMVTLGTGVGSGLVVNGQLVYGHDGFAGEFGHTMLVPDGRLCGCGIHGHLEAYCSAPGIKRTAFELLSYYNSSDSLLSNKSFNELSSKMIYEAAQEGDNIALETFRVTGGFLGQGLADAVHYLSPEAIFLFGGPVAAGAILLDPTKEAMENHLLPVFKNKVKLLPSKLSLGDAAIVGASALVWNELSE